MCIVFFMSIEDIEKKLTEKLQIAPPLGAVLKFDFGDEGHLLLDGTESPPKISREEGEADTTLICTTETLKGIAKGTVDPTMAYMTGTLRVEGSIGYALKLASYLEE